ncbi:MAG: M16 family metallopeptidase, partial [Candidatus Kapaibacteriota bacterium]
SDKLVSVRPAISDYYEAIYGNTSPKDLVTLFELVHLYFTEPRIDKETFTSIKKQFLSDVLDSKNRPEKVFRDSVNCNLWNYNFRRKPLTEDIVESFDMMKMYEIFTERFSDPSDFIFILVGNFDSDSIRIYAEKYIGSIPSKGRKELWKDDSLRMFKGKIEKNFVKGIEKKSYVRIVINGEFDWSYRERFLLDALNKLLDIRLREAIREEKGGTYGVGIWFNVEPFPEKRYSLNITFGCDPYRVNELALEAINVLKDVSSNVQKDIYLTKIKEILKRELEVDLKDNYFWASKFFQYYFYNDSEDLVEQWKDFIDKFTLEDLLQVAKKYIKFDNFAKFVLLPES